MPSGIKLEVCERAYRDTPLTEKQKSDNRRKSKIRSRVEHIFGFIHGHLHGSTFRGKGIARAKFNIGLTNLIYNMERYVFLHSKAIT